MVPPLTQASPQFRNWWADCHGAYFRPATITINHPRAG
jgi:hypothetical protein